MSKETIVCASSILLLAASSWLFTGCKEKEDKVPATEPTYEVENFMVMDSETSSTDSINTRRPYFYWKMSTDVPDGTYAVLRIAQRTAGDTEEDALSKNGKDIALTADEFKTLDGMYRLPKGNMLNHKQEYAARLTVHLPSGIQRSSDIETFSVWPYGQQLMFQSYFTYLYTYYFSTATTTQLLMGFEWNYDNFSSLDDAGKVKYKIVRANWHTTGSYQQDRAQLASASWRLAQVNAATGSNIIAEWSTSSTPPYSMVAPGYPYTDGVSGSIVTMEQFNRTQMSIPYNEVYIFAVWYDNETSPMSKYTLASRYFINQ